MHRTIILIAIIFAAWLPMTAADGDLEFAEKTYDFGTVKSDSRPVEHEFTFTNTGSEAVVILSATTSCGCTKPQYTHKPLKPGNTGNIKVTFLPNGQNGYISKDIKVTYKTIGKKKHRVTLKITGNVIPPE